MAGKEVQVRSNRFIDGDTFMHQSHKKQFLYFSLFYVFSHLNVRYRYLTAFNETHSLIHIF